jgi:hypothetical protein
MGLSARGRPLVDYSESARACQVEIAREFGTVGLILLCCFRVIERVLMCFEFGRGLVADG